MRLSESMKDAIATLAEGPMDDVATLVWFGPRHSVILGALERRGLVRRYPYGGDKRRGCWRLTAEGRVVHEEMAKEEVAR